MSKLNLELKCIFILPRTKQHNYILYEFSAYSFTEPRFISNAFITLLLMLRPLVVEPMKAPTGFRGRQRAFAGSGRPLPLVPVAVSEILPTKMLSISYSQCIIAEIITANIRKLRILREIPPKWSVHHCANCGYVGRRFQRVNWQESTLGLNGFMFLVGMIFLC